MAARPRHSALFVGGLALEGLAPAIASGADIVVLDLEEAVPAARKDEARAAVVAALNAHTAPDAVQLAVRVNPVTTPEGMADIQVMLSQVPSVGSLLLPQVETPEEVRAASRAAEAVGSPAVLYAIIETLRGLDDCAAIAGADPRLAALFFGGFDLSRALGCAMAWEPLLYARSRVVHAAALAGIPALDSPFPDVADLAGLRDNCARVKALGMRGKAAKNIGQVATIVEAFRAS